MKIKTYQVIQFEYGLWVEGKLLERTPEGKPKTILTHFAPDLPKGLEAALIGKTPGSYELEVAPKDAYGEYNFDLREEVAYEDLPDEPRLGGGFAGENDLLYRVVSLNAWSVSLDANHELAGKTLLYRFTIHHVRPAEPGEIEHGHVHGEGGVIH